MWYFVRHVLTHAADVAGYLKQLQEKPTYRRTLPTEGKDEGEM